MKKAISILCILLVLAISCFSQSKDDEARLLYQKAEDLYAQINSNLSYPQGYSLAAKKKDYTQADDYLSKALDLVGITPKIVYLDIKILYDGQNQKVFPQTKKSCEAILKMVDILFSKIDKNNYPQEKMNEMLNIKIAVEQKLKDPKIVDPHTFSSREDAFNFISETIKKYFVTDWGGSKATFLNITWDGKSKIGVFGYGGELSGSMDYYFYLLDITTMQSDKDQIDYHGNGEESIRSSHYFVFPGGNNTYNFAGRYSLFKSDKLYKKGLKNVQTATDFLDKVKEYKDNGIMQEDKSDMFDIFLCAHNTIGGGSFPLFTSLKYDDPTFQNDTEADYVKAWRYLYDTSK